MLYSEIIPVCFEIHTNYTNTLCGQKIDFYFTPGGVKSNHWALKGSVLVCFRLYVAVLF